MKINQIWEAYANMLLGWSTEKNIWGKVFQGRESAAEREDSKCWYNLFIFIFFISKCQ
jgi:hypothetical protein